MDTHTTIVFFIKFCLNKKNKTDVYHEPGRINLLPLSFPSFLFFFFFSSLPFSVLSPSPPLPLSSLPLSTSYSFSRKGEREEGERIISFFFFNKIRHSHLLPTDSCKNKYIQENLVTFYFFQLNPPLTSPQTHAKINIRTRTVGHFFIFSNKIRHLHHASPQTGIKINIRKIGYLTYFTFFLTKSTTHIHTN